LFPKIKYQNTVQGNPTESLFFLRSGSSLAYLWLITGLSLAYPRHKQFSNCFQNRAAVPEKGTGGDFRIVFGGFWKIPAKSINV
jgi:hypothetical protein